MLRSNAVEYAKLGYKVFPCAVNGKIPLTKRGFYDAENDPVKVADLFAKHPNCNIGLCTGKENRFFAIDIDVKNGAGGESSWTKLMEEHGNLPTTPQSLTYSGGRHIYLAFPDNKSIGCKTGVVQGIDIRGDGGYVIAPPSVIDGKKYSWVDNHSITDIPLSGSPEWILTLINEKGKDVDLSDSEIRIIKSKRNTTLASVAGKLRAIGCTTDHIFDILKETNRNRCAPPLPESEVRVIAESIGKYPAGKPEKESINPNVIAAEIEKDHTLLFCDDVYYKYNCTVYKPVQLDYVKQLIKQKLGTRNNNYHNSEILHSLRLDIAIDNTQLNTNPYPNVKNGILDIEKLTIEPHDKKYNSTIQLPVEFNSDSSCPLWVKTLNEIFNDKSPDDVRRCTDTLQEFFGLCLTKETKYEKALFLLGEGRNGKSTILYVLENILGADNYSAITLESLTNQNYVSEIFGKLANISIETNAKTSIYDAMFKSIVSGDVITADRKYGHPFKFRPFCKMIFALNNMPQVNDKTDAFFKRLIIIHLTRQFDEREQNKELKHQLLKEIDGIFLWMIQGYNRLRQRGYFDIQGSIKQEMEDYRMENNSVLSFVEDECILDKTVVCTKNSLYQLYVTWCKDSGLLSVGKNKFGIQIMKHYRLNGSDFSNDKTTRIWVGIKHSRMV